MNVAVTVRQGDKLQNISGLFEKIGAVIVIGRMKDRSATMVDVAGLYFFNEDPASMMICGEALADHIRLGRCPAFTAGVLNAFSRETKGPDSHSEIIGDTTVTFDKEPPDAD